MICEATVIVRAILRRTEKSARVKCTGQLQAGEFGYAVRRLQEDASCYSLDTDCRAAQASNGSCVPAGDLVHSLRSENVFRVAADLEPAPLHLKIQALTDRRICNTMASRLRQSSNPA